MIIAVLYTFFVYILFFFILAWSWGENKNIFQNAVTFIAKKPLDPSISLWFIPINGMVWSLGIVVIKKIINGLINETKG